MRLFVLLVLVAGCHGTGLSSSPDGGEDMTATIKSEAPAVHRAAADACTSPSPPGNCPGAPDFGDIALECSTDSDCPKGRCSSSRPDSCYCEPADCSSDADCTTDKLCGCAAPIDRGHVTNRCLPTNCHIDADCGAGQYCAPAVDMQCGYFIGVTSYACTTPDDTCRTDADCGGTSTYTGTDDPYCTYYPELGHWACGHGQCAG